MFLGWNLFVLERGVILVTASTDLIFYGVGVGGSILIMSFEHNYYFVNCIPINASCRLKEKENGVFFRIKLMTSDTCSIIIRKCICDTLYNMMHSPSQIVPPVFNQVCKFNMAMKSKWKLTSKQVYNHFIFPWIFFFFLFRFFLIRKWHGVIDRNGRNFYLRSLGKQDILRPGMGWFSKWASRTLMIRHRITCSLTTMGAWTTARGPLYPRRSKVIRNPESITRIVRSGRSSFGFRFQSWNYR